MTATQTLPTTRIDLGSDEMARDPWPLLAGLRSQGPILWHETFNRWIVTADHEVRAILPDFRRFTVEGTSVEDLFGPDAFFSMDERERHDELRYIWAEAFRRPALEALRPTLQRIVDQLLVPVVERVRSGESVDVADAICRPLPTMVIALMMGVTDDMIPDVVRWSDAMASGASTYLDAEAARRVVERREAAKADLGAYLCEQIARRRKQPTDDLIGVMMRAPVAGRLPDERLMPNLRQLLFAGNETTAKWLAHIFVTFGERPDLQRELAADRALVPAANDEVMRWQGVVGTVVRRVRAPAVEMGGVKLAEGDDVTLLLGSANRDAGRFPDPDRFDIHRKPEPNLGFGIGMHHCLGINLAKLECETAVNGVLDQVAPFRIAAPYSYSSYLLRGPLPVQIARDA